MKFLLILLFVFPAFGQDLSEIRGKKIYVVTDVVRSVVEKELPKMTVSDPKDAQVFVEYKTIERWFSDAVVGGLVIGSYEYGEMTVYVQRDSGRVPVWTEKLGGSPAWVPKKLAKNFRSALKKS